MNESVFEIRLSSSPQDCDVTPSSSNSSISSQQNTPGNLSQTRRRHSLSLRKIKRENGDQSEACINTSIENKSRQSECSTMDIPSTHFSTGSKSNCEFVRCHSSGQSVGNSTSFRPQITEHCEDHSENKKSKTADIFGICGLNSSSQSSNSSNMSSQHEVAESRLQIEEDNHVLPHEKKWKERKGHTEHHEKNSRRHRARKSLFASLNESSSSSGDTKIVAGSVISCTQNQRSGKEQNIRKTSTKSLVKPLCHLGSQKQGPCSGSDHVTPCDIFETNNIFGKISHGKEMKTDNSNVATPELQNQTKETKCGTKALKNTSKQKSPEGAIVIDDSPDRNRNLRLFASECKNTVQHKAKHKTLEAAGEKLQVNLQGKRLSKNGTARQENVSGDLHSQKGNSRLKKLTQKQTSEISAVLLKHLKENKPAITRLLQPQSLKKKLTEDTVVISSDEEVDERNESQQVQTAQRTGFNKKTVHLKRSRSTKRQTSSTDVKQSLKCNKQIVADSLNSVSSCHADVLETFPALNNSSRSSSLSEEIPYQISNEENAREDSGMPNVVTMSSDTSIRSMPSLQRRQSSIYRSSSFEECSPPQLSQYPVQSPTSLHPPEVIHLFDSPSPLKNDVNKSASDNAVSSDSTMFSQCSAPCNDSCDDNLKQMVSNILDMIDAAADDQHSVGAPQSGCGSCSQRDQHIQLCELKPSHPSQASRQLNIETDAKVADIDNCIRALGGYEKPQSDSERDQKMCILDSDDDFFMNQPFEETHSSEREESKAAKDGEENSSIVTKIGGKELAESEFDDRTALNHLKKNKEVFPEDASSSRIEASLSVFEQVFPENTSSSRIEASLSVFEEGTDQNDQISRASTFEEHCEQEPSTFKEHCEQEPSTAANYSVIVASPGDRSQTSHASLAVVKEEVDDTAFTGAANDSMYTEINDDLYVLDSDDDAFFMSQSFGDCCEDNPTNEESSHTTDVNADVVKEEVEGAAADASVYSEIDEIYDLDSDDDDFFLTQSVLNKSHSEKQEVGQNCIDNEKGSEMNEKFSNDLFEDEDEVTHDEQLNKSSKDLLKDKPGCSTALRDENVLGFEMDSDENDSDFDYLDKETKVLAPLENTDVGCPEIAKSGNSDRNKPCEVNTDDMAKSIIDDEDEYFFSQMDDVDEAYFADTQIDYTTHSGDEFEDTEVECKGCDSAVQSSGNDGNQLSVENNTVAACENMDTQDPFIMETQVCYPSTTNAQNKYDVATLPLSIIVDEEAQTQTDSTVHAKKQNLCDKNTFSNTVDQNTQGRSVSPLLNMDTQDPYSFETQHDSDVLINEHDSLEQGTSQSLPKSHEQNVFHMETQECFQRDNQDKNPYYRGNQLTNAYDQETQAVSPSGSDSSECLFPSVQIQITPQPDVTDRNKKDRETIGESGTQTMDRLKLAKSGQFENGSHTSSVLLNDGDSNDHCDTSIQEKDQLLAQEDAFQGQTQVLTTDEELQSPYNLLTQKNVLSESGKDHPVTSLLNDDHTQKQFDHSAHDKDHLVVSEEGNAYERQTQAFSPGQKLQTPYNLATQTHAQSESQDNRADVRLLNDDDTQDQFDHSTQVNDQLQSKEDNVYERQTQSFSPDNNLLTSYDIATQKYGLSKSSHHQETIILSDDDDTLDQFDLSTKVNDQLQSEKAYAFGGQTQAFSPDKYSQTLYDIATQKYVPSDLSRHQAAIILSDDDDTLDGFDLNKQVSKQLQSEEDNIYEGQTQVFSPDKDSQCAYDIITQKNVPSEENECHLFEIQTLADSTLLTEAAEDLSCDEAQKQLQPASNDNIYEVQTLADSPQEETESVYNMATQRQFESGNNGHGMSEGEKHHALSSVDGITQKLPNKKTERNQQAVLKERCIYEQETLARSQSLETDDFYNMQTQNNFQPDRNSHALSGNEMPITSLDEDTQNPSDCESQGVHLASGDKYLCERDMLAVCQDDSLYNKATQKMFQPERNSPDPYSKETLAMSPTLCETITVDKCENSKSVETKLSLLSSVDTHDPFDMDTDFSSLEDYDRETVAASPSKRNTENNLSTKIVTALSPVRDYGTSDRTTTAVPTCSREGDESSSDSECFLSLQTQKDSSSLAADQDPYTVQTQAVFSSLHEDARDPYSVETLIDSPSGVDILVANDDSQDPFSLETEVDTASFDERTSVSRKTALAKSCNKEAEMYYINATRNDAPHVLTKIVHEKIDSDLSEIVTGSREKQIECNTAKGMSNALLSANESLLKYSEDCIYKDVESCAPETTGNSLSSSRTAQYNKQENINCAQNKDRSVNTVQVNAENSENINSHTVTSNLHCKGKHISSRVNLFKRLSLNISQNVHQTECKDVGNSSEQDSQSPYFVKCKQNSPSVRNLDITEACGQSSPTTGAPEHSIRPRQNYLLSEPPSLSLHPHQEGKAANRFGATSDNSSLSEVQKKQSSSLQPSDSTLEGNGQKKVTLTDPFNAGQLKTKYLPVKNCAKNVFSSLSDMIQVSGAKGLSAQDSCVATGASSSTHPSQPDLTNQCHKEIVGRRGESNFGSAKRPAEHGDETSSKKKCLTNGHSFSTDSFYGKAGGKRSHENEHVLPGSKRIKVIPVENRFTEHKWISVRKGNSSDVKHSKYTSVAKTTSKMKRPRGEAKTTKGTLTCQVELARQTLQSRRRSFKPIVDQKPKSLPNDDNEDVVMPSTQDMMSLGLPILNAKLPVSKKHLASGLPSQGRVASDDKDLQENDKTRPSDKLNHSGSKNSIKNDVFPPVPLFATLSDNKNISSSASGSVMPDLSAVTLTTLSSAVSSKESTEPTPGPSLDMPNCHTPSGSEPAKLITQIPTTVIQPVVSLSETSATETTHTSSVKLMHADTARPSQSNSVDHLVVSTPALSSGTVNSNGPGLPTLQGISKQPANTKSNYQGILKGSRPSELKAASKVTFKDPRQDHALIQKREVLLPKADVSQLKDIPKCKPEAKLYFLSTLLHWNPVWLREKDGIQSLPSLFGSRYKVENVCFQLRMYYLSFDEYVDITLKLLILECWETIYKDWKMCNLRPPVSLEVHCTCSPWQPYKEKEGQSLVCIEVTGLVTQQKRLSIPSAGDLLIVEFWGARKLEKVYDAPRWCVQFAYVKSVCLQNDIRQFRQTYRIFESSPAWKDKRPIAVNMALILQHRGDVISPSKLHKIQVISSLKTIERQIGALINLPESPLCTQLLKPTPGGLFTYRNVQPDAKLLSKLNREQACSVATIVQDIKESPRSQRMFLLQGPPGTGKSHTMLALIHQILLVTNFKGRICLAAPSNAAVDEMAKRILDFSNKLKKSALEGISLVRVGNKSRVHAAVKPYMLEDLVESVLIRDYPESLKSELSALEKDALKMEKALSDQSLTQEQKVMKSRKKKEIQTKIFKLKADMAPVKKNARERYKARCSVLDKAQVICGTLSSLGSEDLKEIVLRTEENPHKKLPFTCLIIDEATQAIEVDCLIPLQYKMNKVVLVGDTEQLPATVLSQMASEKQLARSLFERMDFCIREFTGTSKSPVMMLTRQYRMHTDILHLPNSLFYDGQLITDESVLSRKELIAPYLVFDIQESKESRGANTRSVSNEEEAVCIAQLCEIVSKKTNKIGVICPYTDQQQSILGCLRQRNLAVEVNTVDSFQGQEREVIILSCVRAQSNPSSIGFLSDRKRMNVALTRAKLALYVIGHFETLKTDELWEELYKNAVKRKLLVKVHKTSEFKQLAEKAVCRAKNYSANGS